MDPCDVTKLGPEGIKKFLDSFDHVFSDCDGVIWEKYPLPDSGKFFDMMEQYGKTVHFVSNNSLRNKENYEENFTAAGIQNGFERLTIPSTAIASYLKSINFQKKIYCVSCLETMRVLESSGFKCEYGPDECPDYFYDFIKYLQDDLDIGAVVMDSDFKANLPKLYKAITYLKRPDVHFLSGATDRKVPMKPGILIIGTGVFTGLVEDECQRKSVQLGKPGKLFGEFAMKRAGVTNPDRVLFIGDMIKQDISLGKAVGFKTLLVLTSATEKEMLSETTLRPDYYAPSLSSIVTYLSTYTYE